MSLTLTWSENSVLTSKATRDAVPDQTGNLAAAADNNPTNAAFKITDTKLLVSVNYQSNWKQYLKVLLTRINTGQTKNNNINYLNDPTFTNVNRLFALSFQNEDDRASFSKYYIPSVEIKDLW